MDKVETPDDGRDSALNIAPDPPLEKSALSTALSILLQRHETLPEELAPHLPDNVDPAPIAALVNDRLATALTIATWDLDAIPVELRIPPLPVFRGSKVQIPDGANTPEAQQQEAEIHALERGVYAQRQRFLRELKDQLAWDNNFLTQKFRGEMRTIAKVHRQTLYRQKLLLTSERNRLRQVGQASTFTAEITRLRDALAYTKGLKTVARERSALLAARAKLRLERRLAWQVEHLPRKKLAAQVRRNAADLLAMERKARVAEEYAARAEELESHKQEEVKRISSEAIESYLMELEAEAEIWKDRKLAGHNAVPFSLSLREKSKQERALREIARREAESAEHALHLAKQEARRLKAEHGLGLEKEAYLNKKLIVANLRELNAVKASSLGFDPLKPLSIWKAGEKRARELGLPTESANSTECEEPTLSVTKEQM